jgi:hypothetical protein
MIFYLGIIKKLGGALVFNWHEIRKRKRKGSKTRTHSSPDPLKWVQVCNLNPNNRDQVIKSVLAKRVNYTAYEFITSIVS